MRRAAVTVATALAAGTILVGAGSAEAQADEGWWDWAHRDWIETQRRGPDARGARGGPPFCRNGEGHPVHGRRWCVEKGFGLGSDRRFDDRWDRRGWEDIVLRSPRRTSRSGGILDRGSLADVLGDVILGRLDDGRRLDRHGPLTGRWLRPDGGATVLQIRAGRLPVAELTDLNGDGRVDVVLVARD